MPNPIVLENARTGTPPVVWDLPSGRFGGHPDLQGFVDGFSVNRGQPVTFKIAQSGTRGWKVDIYRLGWYQGHGARLVATLHPSTAQFTIARSQPSPGDCDPGTELKSADCSAWRPTLTWVVPADVPSGVFVARVTRTDGWASHILFVSRDDNRRPAIRVQLADPTWQAYNAFGGLGSRLYLGNSLYYGVGVDQYHPDCARVVSYDRPIVNRGAVEREGYGAVEWSTFFTGEYPAVRWLERNGYDVAYQGGIDAMGGRGPNAVVAMMVGHNEYWSAPMRSSWLAHLSSGGHLFVMASNEVFWRTLGERPDASRRPRLVRCHKETIPGRTSPAAGWTGTWRDMGAPENQWTGTIFAVNGTTLRPLTVDGDYVRHPIWRNTAAAKGGWTSPPEILGFEIDTYGPSGTSSSTAAAWMANPGPAVTYASDTVIAVPAGMLLTDAGQAYGGPGTVHHRLVTVMRERGARTFATGSVNWALGLDNANTANGVGQDNTSPVIRQATVNVLADMGVRPGSPQPGMLVTAAQPW